MKLEINSNTSNDLHTILNEKFKIKCVTCGFETESVFSKRMGNLTFKSYAFGNGLNFHIIKGDVLQPIQIDYIKNNSSIRYLFMLSGDLIVKLSDKVRTRLSSNQSAIIAVNVLQNQIFTFPIQNNLELFFIELNKERFYPINQTEFDGLPKQLSEVFNTNPSENHFLYQSFYTLNVADVYNQMTQAKAEGILKRFFYESKVFELLWLQTEQYKTELLYGYDTNVLRKVDVEIIKKAKEFIHNNCGQELTLSILSRSIGTNETKLKNGFKKLYGKTFTEILLNERLNKAKLLVEERLLSIKEIAQACGYKSVSMFGIRFKERFGVSPSQYKNS